MLRLENVKKTYSRRGESITALDCDHLVIQTGEYISIVGPSGSGKSTLLSLLGGMLSPTSGRVWLDETSLYDESARNRSAIRCERMGFVFQTFNLIPYLSALENVQVPLILGQKERGEQLERATRLLEHFGLGNRLHHRPAEMSIGQQQRVALARTLVNNPQLILADEPTGNLDPESREVVLKALEAAHQEGKTVVMVTHDPAAADRATRKLHLVNGELSEECRGNRTTHAA